MNRPEMPPLYSKPDARAREKHARRQKTATAIIAAGAIISPSSTSYYVNTASQAEIAAQKAPVRCDDPNSQELKAVEDLFAQPQNPELAKIMNGKEKLADFRKKSAKKYGLTVFDYYDFEKPLLQDIAKGSPSDFSLYFNRAKTFLSGYGIELSLGKEGEILQGYGSPLTVSELETASAKKAMIKMIETYGPLPAEFVKQIGITDIKLIDVAKSNVGGYFYTAVPTEYIVDPIEFTKSVNPTQPIPNENLHELTHAWSLKKCGGSVKAEGQDTNFTQLTPYNLYSKSAKEYFLDQEEYLQKSAFRAEEKKKAVKEGFLDSAKKLEEEDLEEAKKVMVARWPGFKNPSEDIATMGEQIFSLDNYQNLLDPRKPFFRKKAIFQLGRIYDDNPALVKYVADTTLRPSK